MKPIKGGALPGVRPRGYSMPAVKWQDRWKAESNKTGSEKEPFLRSLEYQSALTRLKIRISGFRK